MSGIFTATLRFHLDQEEDRAALKYLQDAGRTEYGSYSRAVIAAVNDHVTRLERLGADPYLETREKRTSFYSVCRKPSGRRCKHLRLPA